jgi:hypothetical protein
MAEDERPWMESRTLEWMFVDSLVFDETRRFGDAIKRASPGRRLLGQSAAYWNARGDLDKMQWLEIRNSMIAAGLKFGLFVALPVAVIWWGWAHGYEQQAVLCAIGYGALMLIALAFRLLRKFFTA